MTQAARNMRRSRKNKIKDGGVAVKIVSYAYLIIFSLLILVPFYIMLKTSLTGEVETAENLRFIWWPKNPTLENYEKVLTTDALSRYGIGILRALWNTVWMGFPPMLSSIFITGLLSFVIAKLNFKAKDNVMTFTLARAMIPGVLTTIPSYLYWNWLGLTNTAVPLMIGGLSGGGIGMLFYISFYKGIPDDLIAAAKIDGMSYLRIYTNIMLPLAKPAFVAQIIFGAIGAWNNYMGPLLYLNGKLDLYPLALALMLYQTLVGANKGMMTAIITLSMIPVLIFYCFTQRFFTEGIAMTGIK